MSEFNPEKLSVQFISPANELHPTDERKYTLTHSDNTGQLFLSIGYQYNNAKINLKMRDEVIGIWRKKSNEEYTLFCQVYVSSGEFDIKTSKIRYITFQREMELALKAIINGDRQFYMNYRTLLDSPIYISFQSIYPQFDNLLFYGTPREYLIDAP
ncbi:staygreen family protein [Aquibacillus saliphilus]|uniref:staygreen family protein n=1 Tax=Aquibacillus saliphilus TaxID=1909422 RepID=UPI001CF088A4|nr:staygreen family protein [Aquibacillus saliphilus]